MAVTNNIREIREQRGIYQDDLAARAFLILLAIIILYASFFHEITANVVVMSIKRLLHIR